MTFHVLSTKPASGEILLFETFKEDSAGFNDECTDWAILTVSSNGNIALKKYSEYHKTFKSPDREECIYEIKIPDLIHLIEDNGTKKDLWLLKHMEFIRKWNPETQTVLDLKHAYTEAERLAIEYNDDECLNELINYSRFYFEPHGEHDPSGALGVEIADMLDCNNRIIASDHEGQCLLLYDVDECEYTSGKNEYVIRCTSDVWLCLDEHAYRSHMERE